MHYYRIYNSPLCFFMYYAALSKLCSVFVCSLHKRENESWDILNRINIDMNPQVTLHTDRLLVFQWLVGDRLC